MFNHIVLGSNDLDRSKRFYDAVLATLGFAGEPFRNVGPSGHVRLFYRHNGGSLGISQPIDDEPATCANGGTIGFKCDSPEQVRAFHDAGIAHGGTSIEDPPGPRDGGPMGTMHLAYLRDPDGNKLCAIHRVPA
jgi:catechol 2,3-dioxygenase-like lactoylglutathione lyase family enzyme